jgi:hypothetical protein
MAAHDRRVSADSRRAHGACCGKITINWLHVRLLTTFSRSQHASELRKQWAQQGSNLRPLACKTNSYRRWTWLDVARCGICQPQLWLDVAWRGLMPVDVGSPFGSPISLAPLTFNNPHGSLKLLLPGHAAHGSDR